TQYYTLPLHDALPICPKVKYWIDHRYKQKRAKLALFVPLMVCLTLTGHWGGSLTHGEDYLFAVVTLQVGESKDPVEKIRTIADRSEEHTSELQSRENL